jgi:hypothetical protein
MPDSPTTTGTLSSDDADNIICAGDQVIFTATGGATYEFFVGVTSVQSGAVDTYTTTGLANGDVVSVVVTSAAGCSDTPAGITTTVNALPTGTLVSDDADDIICAGDQVIFTATGGATYEFFVDAVSVQSGAGDTYTTTVLANGEVVTVTVSNASGCTDTPAGIGTSVETIDPPTILGPVTVCNPSTVTYTITDPGSYSFLWTVTNGTIIGSDTNSTVDVLWNIAGQGTVSVGITSVNSCTNSNNITVDINNIADTGEIQSSTSLTRR